MEEDEQKENLYQQLSDTINKTNKGDITIAKIGSKNEGIEKIMSKHGLGIMNENGERLVELFLGNNLVTGGTLFPHKTCNNMSNAGSEDTEPN